MDLIQFICEASMPHPCAFKYKGMAFDGCHYYLTSPDSCEIVKLTQHFCHVESCKTLRPYTFICYDPSNNCFWAGATKCPYKLFKLDLLFREIDCLTLKCCQSFGGAISSVSYDCSNQKLMVCCINGILLVDPACPQDYIVISSTCDAWNTGAVSVSPSYIVLELCGATQFICLYDGESKLVGKCKVPCGYLAEAIVFSPCHIHSTKHPIFHLLATKNGCYSHILTMSIPYSEIDIFPCNYSICDKPCPPVPPHKNPCNDLLESIALMETALSHILNAEGEKLQKVLATTDDIEKILEVNRSIQETLVKATHLEIVLHDKLTVVKSCQSCTEECSCDVDFCL